MKTPFINALCQAFVRAPVQAVLAALLLCSFPAAVAQDFEWAPNFPVGATIPEISAPDQDGNVRTFADLAGEKGLLFMMSRSFDW